MTNDTRAHSYLASFGSTINQFERCWLQRVSITVVIITRFCLVFHSKEARLLTVLSIHKFDCSGWFSC